MPRGNKTLCLHDCISHPLRVLKISFYLALCTSIWQVERPAVHLHPMRWSYRNTLSNHFLLSEHADGAQKTQDCEQEFQNKFRNSLKMRCGEKKSPSVSNSWMRVMKT